MEFLRRIGAKMGMTERGKAVGGLFEEHSYQKNTKEWAESEQLGKEYRTLLDAHKTEILSHIEELDRIGAHSVDLAEIIPSIREFWERASKNETFKVIYQWEAGSWVGRNFRERTFTSSVGTKVTWSAMTEDDIENLRDQGILER